MAVDYQEVEYLLLNNYDFVVFLRKINKKMILQTYRGGIALWLVNCFYFCIEHFLNSYQIPLPSLYSKILMKIF